MLLDPKDGTFEKRYHLVQDLLIACHSNIVGRSVRQPDRIVGDPGSNTQARRRQPPMLKVALDKLSSRGSKEMFPWELRFRHHERHSILQLIAKSVCTAGLVQCRTGPHPASQCLIQQPAVEQNIHRSIGGSHLQCTQGFVPKCCDCMKHNIEVERPKPHDELLRFGLRGCFTKEENYLRMLTRPEFNPGLHGAAGIESGANSVGEQRSIIESGRMLERAMSPKEFLPVARPAHLSSAQVDKCYAFAEIRSPRIPREHCPCRWIDLGRNVRRRCLA